MKIKELYEEYKRLAEITNQVEENDPENEEAWDAAYKAEFAAHQELVDEMIKTLNIDNATARKMIASEKFEELMKCEIIK